MNENDIWVTGIGVVCSAGSSFVEVTQSILEHRLCAQPTGLSLPVPMWGICKDPIPSHEHFVDDRKSLLGLFAAEQAMNDRQHVGACFNQRAAIVRIDAADRNQRNIEFYASPGQNV